MSEGADGATVAGPHPASGSGGVFGRRMGRKLRSHQSALMTDVLPRFEIAAHQVASPHILFPDAAELRVEIGFGGGEHLAVHATSRPEAGFIGCEPYRNGLAKFIERAVTDEIRNVRVFSGDAGLLVDHLPDAALAGVDLFYPDPWPKRRQRKRRFVSDGVLQRLARVMAEGSLLRFATDIDDYAGWTLARALRAPLFAWHARSSADWLQPWAGWSSTRYEAKAVAAGRRPVYLTFRRTGVPSQMTSPSAQDVNGRRYEAKPRVA